MWDAMHAMYCGTHAAKVMTGNPYVCLEREQMWTIMEQIYDRHMQLQVARGLRDPSNTTTAYWSTHASKTDTHGAGRYPTRARHVHADFTMYQSLHDNLSHYCWSSHSFANAEGARKPTLS